ncbi:YncE family protein, partial [Promicromonospora kroppenstedtii]|uniref:YncE family protein n=1 Tax=Promicromonospora kroppenstedtii TaxID=440482 RepID=UPI000687DA71
PAAPATAPSATPETATPHSSATPAPTPSASLGLPARGPTATQEAAATDEQLLLVTQADRDTIALVDPDKSAGSAERPAVLDEITVGAAPWDVAVHADTGRAFVSTAQGVAVVDLATRERTDLVGYQHRPARVAYGEYRPGGLGLAVSPDGDTVYVAVSTGEEAFLEQIDVADGDVVRSVPVGRRPFDVLVSDDGREVYTIDHDGFTVTVVDARSFAAHAIEVAPFGTEGGLASFEKPHYAVLDPDGDLLLPYQGRALARVDPATGDVTTTGLDADTHQHGVARADDGTLVIAGNGPFGNADGGASIEVVSAAGGSTVLRTERRHETVTVWQHDGATFGVLAGGYTQDGAWDGLTVLPLAAALDGADESYEIRVPGRPQAVVPVTLSEPETSPAEGNP